MTELFVVCLMRLLRVTCNLPLSYYLEVRLLLTFSYFFTVFFFTYIQLYHYLLQYLLHYYQVISKNHNSCHISIPLFHLSYFFSFPYLSNLLYIPHYHFYSILLFFIRFPLLLTFLALPPSLFSLLCSLSLVHIFLLSSSLSP